MSCRTLSPVSVPYFQVLDLSNNAFVTDNGVAHLSALRDLSWLTFSGSNQARAGRKV